MSLTSAIEIGRSALAASQLGLQIAGNNIANAGTAGYSRQVGYMQPLSGDYPGNRLSVGRGVTIADVRRQVDNALQSRLWKGTSDDAAAQQSLGILSQIETTLGELTGNDLSTQLSAFFNSWSERANLSKSSSVVVQQGAQLAEFVRGIRSDLQDQKTQLDNDLNALTTKANDLLTNVAGLNKAISQSEGGGTTANSLRDQRDMAITELSKLMDVSTQERPGGMVDVFVGSTPVILGGDSRGLVVDRQTTNGVTSVSIRTVASPETVPVTSGKIGATLSARNGDIDTTIQNLDDITAQVIFQTNRIHSQSSNKNGLTSLLGTLAIPSVDHTVPFNDPANTTFSQLPFKAVNGGFYINVKQASTGAVNSVRIDVDLDGITATGTTGTANDATPESIRATLDAVPGIDATWDAQGRLQLNAQAGFEYTLSDDSSGVLAVMGVNTFFSGSNAGDIAVRSDLKTTPDMLQIGRTQNGKFVENAGALLAAGLKDAKISALGDRSITNAWIDSVNALATRTSGAQTAATSAAAVKGSLEAQRATLSGVSIDEESINLMNYQRQYQGAARVIDVANKLLDSLMQLV
ncbi:MAG: flagellar hook-associated protein FlgK [Planctomycetota bacterium]|nr:flagellar hook-associated protein FlgK [Planctomycetota bacterium]